MAVASNIQTNMRADVEINWFFSERSLTKPASFFICSSSLFFHERNPCRFRRFVPTCARVCFSGSSGGICEKSKLYSDGKKKSLNTGIITVQNYASHVPPKVSHITFAHEVGHNFGSPVGFFFSHKAFINVVEEFHKLPHVCSYLFSPSTLPPHTQPPSPFSFRV